MEALRGFRDHLTSTSHANPRVYEYRPLKQFEIRILLLLKGTVDEPVRAEIEHWDIRDEDQRAYAALSYTWGDPEHQPQPQVVFFGRKVRRVTNNLWLFLKRIRQEKTDLCVWADALSIDQENKVEKAQQIQYMTSIYPQAVKVLVWLGESDETVGTAFETLDSWASAYRNNHQEPEGMREQLRLAQDLGVSNSASSALASLFARPWFRRAWIVQEVLTDFERPPLVLCGLHEISWHRIWTGLFALFTTMTFERTAQLCGENVKFLLPLIAVTWAPEERMTLSEIIPRVMESREAKLPEDKLFSMFGIAARYGHHYLAPNYDLSLRNASLMYTRAVIIGDRSLAILSFVDPASGSEMLPTWAFKLDKPYIVKDEAAIASESHNATLRLPSVVESRHPPTVPDPNLRLRGLPFDHVQQVFDAEKILAGIRKEAKAWSALLVNVRQCCDQHLCMPVQYTKTGESSARALMRTLCRDGSFLCANESPHLSESWQERRRMHVAYMQHTGDTDGSILNEDELAEQVFKAFALGGPALRAAETPGFPRQFFEHWLMTSWCDLASGKINGLKLITTARGLIGLAAAKSRPRDELWLLPGANVPFVLRPQLNLHSRTVTHQLVGDASAHGIMYGEAMVDYQARVSLYGEEKAARSLIKCCLV
ncbi:hypothetical protein LTR56_011671 [Elasticomyces elasticus]|nr:hypothetical protein LTR56_011671 [Elasticomyces elasticus]KAK3658543.1 hypothetical protein LTR22_008896 [Elasticomyces elasticus]KAK4921191.1 hypothetical protein LTR49_011378 [Elasticomyces elasticus]KAK5761908.1 hypothetical protein LTS12_007971 [Elasticomyces elasticus]